MSSREMSLWVIKRMALWEGVTKMPCSFKCAVTEKCQFHNIGKYNVGLHWINKGIEAFYFSYFFRKIARIDVVIFRRSTFS